MANVLVIPPRIEVWQPMTSAIDYLARRAAHDRAAVAAVLTCVRPGLVRYCRSRLGRVGGSYTTADDVAQDVCVALLQALPRYRDQGQGFQAWAYTIASRKVHDAWRSAHRWAEYQSGEPPPERPAKDPGPEELAIRAEQAARVHALLRQLPERQREVLVLRVGLGLSAEKVAGLVGMTPAAVRMAQSRALARLQAIGAEADEVTHDPATDRPRGQTGGPGPPGGGRRTPHRPGPRRPAAGG